MALPFIFFMCFFTFFFLLMLSKIVREAAQAKHPDKKPKLPPGPHRLPLIGNIHNLICSNPHHRLRDLALRYGPVMQLQLGEVPTVVVSSPEIAKEIMKTHDAIFSSRPFLLAAKIMSYGASNIIYSSYGEYWRQLRKICVMELLSAKQVESFRPIREEEVDALVHKISSNEGSPLNLSTTIFSMTYSITSRAAFGSECNDKEAFISMVTEAITLVSGFCLADMYPSSEFLKTVSGLGFKLQKLFVKSDKILQTILDDHKRRRKWKTPSTGEGEGREDLVDVLLRLQHRGNLEFPLTDENIKAVILDIFSAGSETSSVAVEWALSELLRNPEVMERAQSEVREVFDVKGRVDETGIHQLKFLKCVIKETLRLHPPAPLLVPRECSEDCMIEGYYVRAKTKVFVNAWAIHRDPDYWNDPERFNPERFFEHSVDFKGMDFGYIPFGSGRRVCPGILFAMPDIELPLAKILYHFDWKPASDAKLEDLDMTEVFGITVRRKNDLILVPLLRRPLDVE